MKVLLINGSPHVAGCTYRALKEVGDVLNNEGIETVFLHVKNDTRSCIDCETCHKTGKPCVMNDDVSQLSEHLDEYDGFVVGSPVYYAGVNGALMSFLDRLYYSNNTAKFAYKAAAAVTSSRRAGNSTTFDAINKFFLITSMTVIGSDYWNEVHGKSPQEVEQDLEGLRTMRVLGRNMAYYLKMRELAKQNGLSEPESEKRIYTNFIR